MYAKTSTVESVQVFDFGSGSVKTILVEVPPDFCETAHFSSGLIDRSRALVVLYSAEVPVLLGEAVKGSLDSTIPQYAVDELLAATTSLKEAAQIAAVHRSVKVVGVCTAVFRETTNGPAVLDLLCALLGCRVRIASQHSEGLLGFRTGLVALTRSQHVEHQSISMLEGYAENLIVWDSGASSFQLTACSEGECSPEADSHQEKPAMNVLEGAWGSSKALYAAVVGVKRLDWNLRQSPNPMSLEEFEQLVSLLRSSIRTALGPATPSWLRERLAVSEARVVAVGGFNSAFRMCELLMLLEASTSSSESGTASATVFSVSQIRRALRLVADRTDEEIGAVNFPQPNYLLPKLALAVAVMEEVGVERFRYESTVGCTLGLLVSPEMW